MNQKKMRTGRQKVIVSHDVTITNNILSSALYLSDMLNYVNCTKHAHGVREFELFLPDYVMSTSGTCKCLRQQHYPSS